MPPTVSTAPPATIAVATTEPTDEPGPEKIMEEFLQKFGRGAKASAFYAPMVAAFQDEKTTMSPLEIPPRPSTFQRTPTARSLTSHKETPQNVLDTLTPVIEPPSSVIQAEIQATESTHAPVLQHVEAAKYPHEELVQEVEGDDKEEKNANNAGGAEGEKELEESDDEPEGNEGDERDVEKDIEGDGQGRERERK